MHYSTPVTMGLSRSQVETLAESIAKQLRFEPGADLVPVVTRAGGRITYSEFRDLSESDSGSLEVHAEQDFDIFLSHTTSPTRDRFTIAHELGHYILHFLLPRKFQNGQPKNLRATRYGSDRTEWEANWFAAAFLMPAAKFRTAHAKASANTSTLATAFGVSQSAVVVRIKSLGL